MKGWRVVAAALLFGACRTTDAVNKSYDLSKVKRIGVLAFDYGSYPRFGAEDIFAKHLLEKGYRLIERSRLEAVMGELKLGAAGVLSPDGAKAVGKVLGVDAVVMGQITAYEPERKTLVMVDSHTAHDEPIFKQFMERGPKGKMREVTRQVGVNTTRETKQIPFMMPVEAAVGLAVKLVDIESGEVVWAGSDTNEGVNGPLATEGIAARLVKGLAKKWKP
ncbi:MAG: hypothetical protein HYZ75_02675 [Elusimicrobia bacterium]|nr:hypothetical protein [Elusimicrobiota bacterium]